MKKLMFYLVSLSTAVGCGVGSKTDDTIGVNGTLTQISGIATELECPNGGITLDYGIDSNSDGTINPDEVVKTYVLCHGKDGNDADVTALKTELETLKEAVALNTAKVGITSGQAATISANTAKTGITTRQTDAILANTSKAGITNAQANAIIANTAKVGLTAAQADAITANTAKTGITYAQSDAITANTAKTGITTAQADAITANTAEALMSNEQIAVLALEAARLPTSNSVVVATVGTIPLNTYTGAPLDSVVSVTLPSAGDYSYIFEVSFSGGADMGVCRVKNDGTTISPYYQNEQSYLKTGSVSVSGPSTLALHCNGNINGTNMVGAKIAAAK